MDTVELEQVLLALYKKLRDEKKRKYDRHVSFGDLFTDRWETASYLGFDDSVSCYDNVLVIGDVNVGERTWIGPNVILDGSGKLEIGSFCSISAGAQLYTHSTVNWSTTKGEAPIEYAPTRVGSGVYIGPQAVIQMGVTIGDGAIIGAMSFVNEDVPAGCKAWGSPARIVG